MDQLKEEASYYTGRPVSEQEILAKGREFNRSRSRSRKRLFALFIAPVVFVSFRGSWSFFEVIVLLPSAEYKRFLFVF